MNPSNNFDKVRSDITWIISTRPDLVAKAKLIAQGKYNPNQDDSLNKDELTFLRCLLNLIIVNPNDLHGKVYVTDNVESRSHLTASSITIANWINGIFSFPLFFFLLESTFFPIFAGMVAMLATGGVLGIGNIFGASVAKCRKGNRSWSLWGGLLALVGLNVIQTGATGIGVEMMNNRSELNRIYATKIANNYLTDKENQITYLQQSENPIYLNVKERCDVGTTQFNTLPPSHPNRDALYVSLYGAFAQKDTNWNNLPFEKLPVCRQVTRLENEKNQELETAILSYQNLLTERSQTGSDLVFLEKFAPQVFNEHFTNQREIKSGTILVGLATTEVFNKISSGKWTELGLSYFIFILSAITSIASCVMALTHALSKDVQNSYDPQLQIIIDDYFQEMRQALMSAQANDTHIIPEIDPTIQSLENSYYHEYEPNDMGTGNINYPLPEGDEKEWQD
ncbi:hypothetical protein WEU38_00990 [Cyanobacterium aponinum AL20118]|uniref:Uncharacterized protein n=1 Tax=Cyanobacterium aponinum AL20115 TaxID=3090662 RepID=A0AAF0ZIQ1_9CHRO|nr:hypothetical protein [Cyanobacterium aponinum]WPF88877.1 hypothetical protein SAY89_00995 [Cyanobacterium aponinum AL20115]